MTSTLQIWSELKTLRLKASKKSISRKVLSSQKHFKPQDLSALRGTDFKLILLTLSFFLFDFPFTNKNEPNY